MASSPLRQGSGYLSQNVAAVVGAKVRNACAEPVDATPEQRDMMKDLERRYEAHVQEVRGRAAREHQAVQRMQFGETFSFFREGAALSSIVSDEVGVMLGKLKAFAVVAKLPVLTQLVEQLYAALERQLVMYYKETREKYLHGRGSKSLQRNSSSSFGGIEMSKSADIWSDDDDESDAGSPLTRARQMSVFAPHFNKSNNADEPGSPRRARRSTVTLDAGGGTLPIGRGSVATLKRSSSIKSPSRAGPSFSEQPPSTAVQSPSAENTPSSASVSMPSHSGFPTPSQPTTVNFKGMVQPNLAPTTSIPPGSSPSSLHATKLTLVEGMSATMALFAESLACASRCEVVRIYIADEKRNLRKASEFPFVDTGATGQLDMLNGSYTERALAKSLFSAVCEKGLAVHGQDTRQIVEDVQQQSHLGEDEGSTKSTNTTSKSSASALIRNCLVWPIIMPSGHMRIAGMILLLNKEGTTDEESRKFTPDDEVAVFHTARLLGAILERYPKELFYCDVGSLVFKLTHPELSQPKPHLPLVIRDEVEGAERIANEALRTLVPVVIYRGPMVTVYKQTIRDKRVEDFTPSGANMNGITTVEYNLDALNGLWKAGYDENVLMHAQCRMWSTKVKELQAVIKQFVEAIVAARGMKDYNELLLFLRSLELLVRSENAPLMLEHIQTAAEGVRRSLLGGGAADLSPVKSDAHKLGHATTTTATGAHSQMTSGFSLSGASLPQAAIDNLRATVSDIDSVLKKLPEAQFGGIASIHVDGPSNVRGYTCDPPTKRLQVRAIDALIQRHSEQVKEKHEMASGPRFTRPTETSSRKVVERPPSRDGELEDDEILSGVPAASRKMIFAPNAAATPRTPFRLQMQTPQPPRQPSSTTRPTPAAPLATPDVHAKPMNSH